MGKFDTEVVKEFKGENKKKWKNELETLSFKYWALE